VCQRVLATYPRFRLSDRYVNGRVFRIQHPLVISAIDGAENIQLDERVGHVLACHDLDFEHLGTRAREIDVLRSTSHVGCALVTDKLNFRRNCGCGW